MKEITIDLLRHGDVAGGTKLLGKTDEPLSLLGWQQLRSTVDGKTIKWDKVVSSPLLRCLDFSEEITAQHSVPLFINAHFQEVNFGLWDGQLFADLYAGDDTEQLIQFMQDPSSTSPPEGESYSDFELRVVSAWQALLCSLHEEGIEHCLLVTHGGVIRTIMSHVLGFPSSNLFRIQVPYACVTRIKQYEDYPPRLIFHGGSL
jgi:alpha-ribazole phosphatase